MRKIMMNNTDFFMETGSFYKDIPTIILIPGLFACQYLEKTAAL
jgi:hypothetical protein